MDTQEIERRLAACMPSLCGALGLQGRRDGVDLVALNPTRDDKRLGSFRIAVEGSRIGVWADFATTDQGGGGLSLIKYVRGGDWKATYAWAKNFLGSPDSEKIVKFTHHDMSRGGSRQNRNKKSVDAAMAIWLSSQQSIKDTPADVYLQGRGLDLRQLGRQPSVLRYNPKCDNYKEGRAFPALVIAFHENDGKFAGVQRIYLPDENGEVPAKGNAKLAKSSYRGCYVRIWRGMIGDKLQPAFSQDDWKTDTVYVAEGVADALAAAILCPEKRVVVALSVSNFGNLEFAPCIKNVVLLADNDPEGSAADLALNKSAQMLSDKGYSVFIARSPVGKDFADATKDLIA